MNPQSYLHGCLTKIDRARDHVYEFNDALVAGKLGTLDTRTIRAKRERTFPGGTAIHEAVFYIEGATPVVPPHFGVLAGEVVYHLRSALDHLVYQLILVHTGAPPTFNSAFPIVGKGRMTKKGWRSAEAEYEAQIGNLKQAISPQAGAFLRQLQPFHEGDAFHTHPLWALSELCNTDKHRLLNLTVHGVSEYRVKVTIGAESFEVTFRPPVRIEDGTELGRMPLPVGLFRHPMRVDGDLVIKAAFDQIGTRRNVPVIDYLEQLVAYVDGVIKAFMTLPEWGWTVNWPLQMPPARGPLL